MNFLVVFATCNAMIFCNAANFAMQLFAFGANERRFLLQFVQCKLCLCCCNFFFCFSVFFEAFLLWLVANDVQIFWLFVLQCFAVACNCNCAKFFVWHFANICVWLQFFLLCCCLQSFLFSVQFFCICLHLRCKCNCNFFSSFLFCAFPLVQFFLCCWFAMLF